MTFVVQLSSANDKQHSKSQPEFISSNFLLIINLSNLKLNMNNDGIHYFLRKTCINNETCHNIIAFSYFYYCFSFTTILQNFLVKAHLFS